MHMHTEDKGRNTHSGLTPLGIKIRGMETWHKTQETTRKLTQDPASEL